jgi:hypothetical protein
MSDTMGSTPNLPGLQAAVIDLGARYCAYVDAVDLPNIVTLFAADGAITVNGTSHRGPDALKAFFGNAPRGIHLSGLPFVTLLDMNHLESVQNFLFVADADSVVKRGTYRDHISVIGHDVVFDERLVDSHPTD